MSRIACCVIVVFACTLAPAAAGVGPSLPALEGGTGVESMSGNVHYVTRLSAAGTTLTAFDGDGRAIRSAEIAGSWGIPLVTLNGGAGGLSPDGRVLVLSDNTSPGGSLRARSGFAVVDTATLALKGTIHLHGEFSFDALSPQGSTLYLIQHVSQTNVTEYKVRAYDLKAGRLLAHVIADKRQKGWIMNGFPVNRAASANGRWVYTLYQQGDNYPFIHALDTVDRTAVCIGLPWDWAKSGDAIARATLELDGGKLRISGGGHSTTRFVLDTQTFRIAASGEHTTA